MPLVSVIIPFYNRIKWTVQAIDSVLNQTIQDFEIILVNDGSTRGIEGLDKILKHKKIKYVYQQNKGVASARNLGFSQSSGEFIAFLDSDDLFYPQKIEIQLKYMEQNPLVLMSHTSYDRVDQYGNFIETMHSGIFSGKLYPEIYFQCPIATPTVMLRKLLCVEKLLCFDERISVAEDLLFWAKIAQTSEILGIDEPLSKVRIHGSNAFYDKNKQITGFLNVIEYGIKQDSYLQPGENKIILSKCYGLISTIFLQESDLKNSLKYSQLSIKSSLLVWVKTVINFQTIRQLIKKIPGLEPMYRFAKKFFEAKSR